MANSAAPVERGGRYYNARAPLPSGIVRTGDPRTDPTMDQNSLFYQYKETSRAPGLVDQFGRVMPRTDDVAFQPPENPTAAQLRAEASIIHREIPIVSTQTGWSPQEVRNAISAFVIGLFDQIAQMVDTLLADSRVQSAMGARVDGLLGCPVKHSIPKGYEDDEDAKKALKIWTREFDRIMPESTGRELLRWTHMLQFCPMQNLVDRTGKYWIPMPQVWHPRYVYYHWTYRCFVAITQDGQVPIMPGNGHWVLHAPNGGYRGWMRGAAWGASPWWLARQYTLRDWSRFCERHGMPIILALTPAAGDPGNIAAFRAALSNLGQETVVQLPQGVEPQYSYDMKLLEATDQNWQGFYHLIEQCSTEIILLLLGQNLTTEVQEGSFAAARIHAGVKQSLLAGDDRALSRTVREQVAKPFAAWNWGRPEIAPVTTWDVTPVEDNKTRAQVFQSLGTGIMALRRAGKEIRNLKGFVKQFGIDMRLADVADVEPLQGGMGGGHE